MNREIMLKCKAEPQIVICIYAYNDCQALFMMYCACVSN